MIKEKWACSQVDYVWNLEAESLLLRVACETSHREKVVVREREREAHVSVRVENKTLVSTP